MSKYGVFSGPYSVRMRENTDQKNLRIWTLFTECLSHLIRKTIFPEKKIKKPEETRYSFEYFPNQKDTKNEENLEKWNY